MYLALIVTALTAVILGIANFIVTSRDVKKLEGGDRPVVHSEDPRVAV
jgi:hypothetical protein